MSEENVELLLKGLELWGEFNVDAMLELLDPEIEWTFSGRLPDATGTIHGRAAVGDFMRSWAGAWSKLSMIPKEIVEAGDDLVVDLEFVGRARDGLELSLRLGHVWTSRNGLAIRFRAYPSFDEALKAVGLAG
jgi:ketosteroid isomerase-like protein